jgi:hypothetical protein
MFPDEAETKSRSVNMIATNMNEKTQKIQKCGQIYHPFVS